MLEPGIVLAGRYRLDRRLAVGAMGEVWIATHTRLDKLVAVKLMTAEAHASEVLRARFEREARVCAQIRSPHVVQVHDYGIDLEVPWLVMDLLEGEDLHAWRQRRPVFPLAEVASIVAQAAQGLAAAHAIGVIHRDIKPSNLFMTRGAGGTVLKILDFGVAKAFAESAHQVTRTDVVLGSPRYMSPEQIEGGDVDARSDLWSLAVLAFLLLTGKAPFQGDVGVPVAERILLGERLRVSQAARALPAALEGFFDRALSAAPDARYQSAEELAAALVAIAVAHGEAPAEPRRPAPDARTRRSFPVVEAAPRTPLDPRPGDVLGGKYRVERVLGRGGMGIVLEVRHLGLDEVRALKLMLPRGVERPEARERFFREARSAVKLRSEHAVRVHDVGILPEGAPYIEMELLHGHDLAAILAEAGRISIVDAVRWIREAASAVDEAHRAGIVHRDIKPENLFLARSPTGIDTIKVLDFGIAKDAATDADPALTATNASFGSPYYMSPEQMRGVRHATARSDVWGLGVVLHELLVGQRPFQAKSVTALALAVVREPAPPPSSLREEVPASLDAIVARCLEKDPERRFASAAQLATALQAALSEVTGAPLPQSPPPNALPPGVDPLEDPETLADDLSTLDGAAPTLVLDMPTQMLAPVSRSRSPSPSEVLRASPRVVMTVAALLAGLVLFALTLALIRARPQTTATTGMPSTLAPGEVLGAPLRGNPEGPPAESPPPSATTAEGPAPPPEAPPVVGPLASASATSAPTTPPRGRGRPTGRPRPSSGFSGVK